MGYQPSQRLTEIDTATREWKDSIKVSLPANEKLVLLSNTYSAPQRKITIDVVAEQGQPAGYHTLDVTYTRVVGEDEVKAIVKKNGNTEGEDEESYPG